MPIVTKNQQESDSSKGYLQTLVRSRLSLNAIHNGDSFTLCEQIEAKSVDMILEDMPYNTTACEWDVKIDLNLYWETRLRILKPTGVVVLTGSQPFTSFLVMSNLKMFKYEWIWGKNTAGDKMNAKNKAVKMHENILIFSKGTTANCSNRRMLYNPQGLRPSSRKRSGIDYGNYGKSFAIVRKSHAAYIQEFEGYPTTLLYYTQDKIRLHPTQKPVGLFEYLIRTYTNEGDLVFDGFGGSGTTAIAAHRSKRNFIVIEKNLEYYEKSKQRLEIEQAQQVLF